MTDETILSELSEKIKGSLEREFESAGEEDEVSYLNVMQALVENMADQYIPTAGVCMCPRCRIDIIALTLSRLPSKYVVLGDSDAVPMLSLYESRYSANIRSQLTAACEIVRQHPRHGEDGEQEPPRGLAFVR